MSSTGTRKPRNVQDRASEAIIESDKALIQSFKVFTESSNDVAGLAGAAINNSPKTPAGNYLAREGDSMIGPLALGPPLNFRIDVDSNNTIDIGPLNENAQYASNVQLDDLQPNSSVLDIIANAAFDGQVLLLRTVSPTAPYTISQATLANGGNIQTGDSSDLTLGDLQTVTLIFDASLRIFENTGGTWRITSVSSGTGGGGGEFFGPWTANHDAGNFALNDVSSIQIVDNVGGVHGLLQGLADTGVRLSLTTEESFSIFAGIVEIARFSEEAAGIYRFDMKDHTIKDAKDIRFDVNADFAGPGAVPVIGYNVTESDFIYNAPDTAKHVWTTNNNELMGLTASQLTFAQGLKIQANPNPTNPGLSVGQIADDPTSTTNGDLWYDITTHKLRTTQNDVDIDVVGGAASFPIDFPEEDVGTIGNITQIVDFSEDDRHSKKYTLNGDVAFAFNNEPSAKTAYANLIVLQDGTGGHTVTLPPNTINKEIVEAGILLGPNEETGIVIKFAFGINYAFLETGNVVTGGSSFSGNLSDLTIDVNKNWLAAGISNLGALSGVTGIDLDGATATIQGVQTIDLFQGDQSIESVSGEVKYNTANLGAHAFYSTGTKIAEFVEETATIFRLDMLDHTIKDAKDIRFDSGASYAIPSNIPGIGYDDTADDLKYNAPNNAKHVWTTNNIERMGLTASQLTFAQGLKIQANPNGTNPGLSVGEFGGDPANTTDGDLWYNGSSNKLRTKQNNANVDVIQPITGFANIQLSNLGTTSINANLIPQAGKLLGTDALPWSALNTNRIRIKTAGTFNPSDNEIIADATNGMEFNTPAGDIFRFFFNGTGGGFISLDILNMLSTGGFEGAFLNLLDSSTFPVIPGRFQRNGDIVALQTPIFEVRRNTLLSADASTLNFTKVDSASAGGDNVAEINFQVFDTPTLTTYGSISAQLKEQTDSGSLFIGVRANNSSIQNAITIAGDDDNARTYATLNSKINSNLLFGTENAVGGTFKIGPDSVNGSGASIQLGIVVQDNVAYTMGSNGTIAIPIANLTTVLTIAILDGAFGSHKGAIGIDINSLIDNRLWVRLADGTWRGANLNLSVTS